MSLVLSNLGLLLLRLRSCGLQMHCSAVVTPSLCRNLANLRISGSLPRQLRQLTALTTLDLQGNRQVRGDHENCISTGQRVFTACRHQHPLAVAHALSRLCCTHNTEPSGEDAHKCRDDSNPAGDSVALHGHWPLPSQVGDLFHGICWQRAGHPPLPRVTASTHPARSQG
jgi:hypothetical protein